MVGGERQFDAYMLSALADGMYVRAAEFPAVKPQAKRLNQEIWGISFPRRMVFKHPRKDAKALPAIEEPIQEGHRLPGSLTQEHLETLNTAISELADRALAARHYTPGISRLSYMRDVENFKAGDVLCCKYKGEQNEEEPHPYYFWYREAPAGLDELVKTLPPDHPIRLIGPPRTEAPTNLQLAMEANAQTAAAIEKRLADKEANSERALADAVIEASGVDPNVAKFLRPLFHAAADADTASLRDSERVVKASGGAKKLCPKCHGYKRMVVHGYNSRLNPHESDTLSHHMYELNRNSTGIVNCDECGGTGVVDAR